MLTDELVCKLSDLDIPCQSYAEDIVIFASLGIACVI